MSCRKPIFDDRRGHFLNMAWKRHIFKHSNVCYTRKKLDFKTGNPAKLRTSSARSKSVRRKWFLDRRSESRAYDVEIYFIISFGRTFFNIFRLYWSKFLWFFKHRRLENYSTHTKKYNGKIYIILYAVCYVSQSKYNRQQVALTREICTKNNCIQFSLTIIIIGHV